MTVGAPELIGRVNFITGPDKGSGKTAFLNYALGQLRIAGEVPAFLGVGLDGEADAEGRSSLIACMPGELFLSSERYLRRSGCEPEIVAALPGPGALGRLAIARARRRGTAVLVGPEANELTASAIAIMRDELGARTVLVDGAMNRITQVSSFPGARFYFAMSAGPADFASKLRSMRRLSSLAALSELGDGAREKPDEGARGAGLPTPAIFLEGPLTGTILARVGKGARTIVVEDFTKVFLGWDELRSLSRNASLAVLHGVDFGGFVLRLRDIAREEFARSLGDAELEAMVAFNPYEGARVA